MIFIEMTVQELRVCGKGIVNFGVLNQKQMQTVLKMKQADRQDYVDSIMQEKKTKYIYKTHN